jgi:hypothetical protein
MQKLPYAQNAVIEIVKLRDYCLSTEHPRGRHKSRVFHEALGLTVDDGCSRNCLMAFKLNLLQSKKLTSLAVAGALTYP